MGDDDEVAPTLQLIDDAVVFAEVDLVGIVFELKQKLVAAIEVEPVGPFEAQALELCDVDLKAHLQRKAARLAFE